MACAVFRRLFHRPFCRDFDQSRAPLSVFSSPGVDLVPLDGIRVAIEELRSCRTSLVWRSLELKWFKCLRGWRAAMQRSSCFSSRWRPSMVSISAVRSSRVIRERASAFSGFRGMRRSPRSCDLRGAQFTCLTVSRPRSASITRSTACKLALSSFNFFVMPVMSVAAL